MKWFRIQKYQHTNEGGTWTFVDRILAASYSHAYELADRLYGPGNYDAASVPPFSEDRYSVACNLRPRTFIVGL